MHAGACRHYLSAASTPASALPINGTRRLRAHIIAVVRADHRASYEARASTGVTINGAATDLPLPVTDWRLRDRRSGLQSAATDLHVERRRELP
jgi:hypothetical protein